MTYIVDLDIDVMRKRLTPDRRLWETLPQGAKLPACVRSGALGVTVIVHLTSGCGAPR